MATAKKTTTKRKRSVTAKKLCSKVIKREGIKADGTLMKGFRWAKGGGRAIKVVAKKSTAKKTDLGKAAPAICTRRNSDGTSTSYSADNSGGCRYGGVRNRSISLKGAKRKTSAKKPIRKHEGINQTTGKLKKGYKYSNGKVVKAKVKK